MSHPAWVRGLKRNWDRKGLLKPESHPAWVRGLKLEMCEDHVQLKFVAPCVGAWIETLLIPI